MATWEDYFDAMDALMDEYNNPNSDEMKWKAQAHMLQMDLDIERNVSRNHEHLLHLSDQRIHELDDKVDTLERELSGTQLQLELAELKIQELTEKLERQKRKRKMDQWLCETIEEYENLTASYVADEMENERKRLRDEYGS